MNKDVVHILLITSIPNPSCLFAPVGILVVCVATTVQLIVKSTDVQSALTDIQRLTKLVVTAVLVVVNVLVLE